MNAKEKFNPYPEGIIKPIEKFSNLDPEHKKLYRLFNLKKTLESQLKRINEQIDKEEAKILKRIDSGEKFDWCWKWIFERTTISWKSVCEQFIGKKKVDEISARTKATQYPHIGIEGIHPRPFTKPKKLQLRKPIK